ncbi:MAG: outer membrane protein transport protein [Bacteroidetes bacterium]|nr:outer membrane protein transport protein [Bacteroidota bacterium]
MRYIYFFLFITASVICHAQQVMDAYLMFPMQTSGSARIAAMGGSSTALGGDISTLFHNPAGLSQYRTNEVVFSPGFRLNQLRTNYNEKDFSDQKNTLNIGASGIVMSTAHYKKNKLVRTNWGIAFNQTANFNSRLQFNGINQTSSFSEKWVEELIANNIRNFDDALFFSPAGASLAVENYLVDSILDNNVITGYRSNAIKNAPFSLSQSFSQQISGSANELALGFSRNQSEKFFYGMTLGIPFFRRVETLTVEEKDLSGNTDNDFEQFRFTETISTIGTGFLLRAGLLYKPIDRVRIGLNLQSPSFYTLTRSIDARLETSVENYARKINNDNTRPQQFSASTQDITGGTNYSYDYQVITPWTAAIAIAYVFRETENVKQQRGMITAEAEFVNHRGTRFSTAQNNSNVQFNQYFQVLNNQIRSFYRPALNFRIGGELKFNTLMFRGGFQYLQSPFENARESFGIKGYRIIPSIGAGYRDKGIFLDLTYSHLIGDQIYFPYILQDNAYPFARSQARNGQILATVGFKF